MVIVPPRKSHDPLWAKSEDKLNDTNIIEVLKNAVGTMLGSIKMTCSNNGPIPKPKKESINLGHTITHYL